MSDGICAIIPARGGSKSIPKKNIRDFQGHPMIAWTIVAAKMSEKIDRIVVSTDSEEIAEIAKQYGAETPFLRPKEYARDDSPDIEFVEHAIKWFEENENYTPGYLVHLRPTSPIRDYRIIDRGIETILEDPMASSLRSGHISYHPPYKWFKIEPGKYATPIIDGLTCDDANNPRQDFPEVMIPNGYVDVLNTSFIKENHLLHGDRMIGFITKEIPDIDVDEDLYKLDTYQDYREVFDELKHFLDY